MNSITKTLLIYALMCVSGLEISGQDTVKLPGLEQRLEGPMRELTGEEIKKAAPGIYNCQYIDSSYYFQRFPVEALEVLKTSAIYHIRAEATSGVRLKFRSSTTKLVIEGKVFENSPQTESFIILCNDTILAELPARGIAGDFGQMLNIPEKGEKNFEICFPAYASGTIRKILIEKNSSFTPLKRKGVYFAMGNSITQLGGRYMGYADIVARGLNLDLHEAGIGGHIFDAESVPFAYIEKPLLITLAYGTNDWSGGKPIDNARLFLNRITLLYPSTPIFLLGPIHRYTPVAEDGKKLADNNEGISLMDYRKELRSITKNYPTVKVVNYKKLMPDDPNLFIDKVHPTEKGQRVFGNNLLRVLKKYYQ